MNAWLGQLRQDPLPGLLAARNEAIQYFARRDLMDEDFGPVEQLWNLPQANKILRKQLSDGSWTRPGENRHPAVNVRLVETFRNMRFLVEQYGFTCVHPQIERAAGYLYSCQTEDGDFRGILANQYATYYTGAILSLLIQAGYADDGRTERCIRWLLGMRQMDYGWSIPMITHRLDRDTQYRLSSEYAEPLEPNRAKPFSHNATGMILRAFANHPVYRASQAAKQAAGLMKTRFFQPDAYTSYHDSIYWVRFEYPFWWNNLVAALDSISKVDPVIDEPVHSALEWLAEHQCHDGLWNVTYANRQYRQMPKSEEMRQWVSLAICRVLKGYLG